jgi:hypothetical protein
MGKPVAWVSTRWFCLLSICQVICSHSTVEIVRSAGVTVAQNYDIICNLSRLALDLDDVSLDAYSTSYVRHTTRGVMRSGLLMLLSSGGRRS